MITSQYAPTSEQQAIIGHDREAFVTACPGAGKTRTIVERVRHLSSVGLEHGGVALLSFTNAAVQELEARIRAFGVLAQPLFPSFIGTFDSFLWQFVVLPFGIPNCDQVPRLIPDKGVWEVTPFDKAQAIPFKCFSRTDWTINADLAKESGFNTTERQKQVPQYEKTARTMHEGSLRNGLIDFEDLRECVKKRLADADLRSRLGKALAGRFREIIVDEAQDCNPADLEVVEWFREAGIVTKVICDPNQSIYGFRGGVTDELEKYAEKFGDSDRLPLSGNFRSTPAICKAIAMLRSSSNVIPDEASGPYKDETGPVHILSYSGTSVPSSIGSSFGTLAAQMGIPLQQAPVLAATSSSANKAIGLPSVKSGKHKTLLLAEAIMSYHFAFAMGNRRNALTELHRAILLIRGIIETPGDYRNYLVREGIEDGTWRPEVMSIATSLRFAAPETSDQWLEKARNLLASTIVAGSSINKRLPKSADLQSILIDTPAHSCPARTIHSVKGMEFLGACVVLTSQTVGGILECLECGGVTGGVPHVRAEDARKIYVAASRAKRLLAIAIPKNQASRLIKQLQKSGCVTQEHNIG